MTTVIKNIKNKSNKSDFISKNFFLPKCDICGLKFLCKKSLENHKTIKKHVSLKSSIRKSLKNSKTQKKFKKVQNTTNDFKRNKIEVLKNSKINFICDYDGMDFKSKETLEIHMISHTSKSRLGRMKFYSIFNPIKPLESIENSSFEKSEKNFSNFEIKKLRSFNCNQCQKPFNRKENLDQHLRITHPKELLQCDLCGKLLKTRLAMKYHINIHIKIQNGQQIKEIHKNSSDRKFKCETCPARFKIFNNLTAHESIHNKKFECNLCNKKFGILILLTRHVKEIHENPGSYGCGICGRKFNKKGSLKTHEKIHKKNLN